MTTSRSRSLMAWSCGWRPVRSAPRSSTRTTPRATTTRSAPTPPRRTDMARNAAAHAGRTLVILLIGIAVLFGLVALGGTWKPALGLDLQGGTRITLTANGNPSKENLDEA